LHSQNIGIVFINIIAKRYIELNIELKFQIKKTLGVFTLEELFASFLDAQN